MDDAEKKELNRIMTILSKIRDIVEIPDPRFPNGQWYKALVDHVRRYLAEIFPGDEEDT